MVERTVKRKRFGLSWWCGGLRGVHFPVLKGLKMSSWFRWADNFSEKWWSIREDIEWMETMSAKNKFRVLREKQVIPIKLFLWRTLHPPPHQENVFNYWNLGISLVIHSISMQQSIAATIYVWKLLKKANCLPPRLSYIKSIAQKVWYKSFHDEIELEAEKCMQREGSAWIRMTWR